MPGTPQIGNVTARSSMDYTSIADGTDELRVTGSSNNSDLRFSLSSFTLSDQEIVMLIISEASGSHLANMITLPQQGMLTTCTDPWAGVRGDRLQFR